ncbi:hypothetical protein PRECH8_26180 [Insulibacter thermoxylanivorax]|uniref:Uncharacterized protein n=1 Tax=Insulibacter thermoxylanivorax TaxID=2749268 RepID=A0A916VGE3_9BACL|nr:hypothetical protein [Insulibacter thermoxylanivorax]GFR39322.1 hypothetical protein PRECH8_26180 [Insulibacter thermoxylanivorax]
MPKEDDGVEIIREQMMDSYRVGTIGGFMQVEDELIQLDEQDELHEHINEDRENN